MPTLLQKKAYIMSFDKFGGLLPAMCTPFDSTGEIDFERVKENAQRLEQSGVDGIVPTGSTGEAATLTHNEHIEVIEAVIEAVNDTTIIAGAGSNNTKEALSLSQRAEQAGADCLLLISPYYNMPEQRGLQNHFETVADEVNIPVIVYNVPSRTGQNIEPSTAIELAKHDNIKGYKAASGDVGQISEIIEKTRDQTFDVLSGDDEMTVPIISVGGTGCISVAGNVAPHPISKMIHAALDGDFETAQNMHHELAPLFRAMFWETNPIPVKAAMEVKDFCEGNLRPPLSSLDDQYYERLSGLLTEY
jgi:4-hydroxy-tetrahydrodipicolinate synthase